MFDEVSESLERGDHWRNTLIGQRCLNAHVLLQRTAVSDLHMHHACFSAYNALVVGIAAYKDLGVGVEAALSPGAKLIESDRTQGLCRKP